MNKPKYKKEHLTTELKTTNMNQENKGVKSNEVCKLCLHQECLTCNQCHNINCFLFLEPLKSCFDALLPQSLEEKGEENYKLNNNEL